VLRQLLAFHQACFKNCSWLEPLRQGKQK
jgi:hypothetical protein